MSNKHSIVAPSSAYIWGPPGGCTGYVPLSQQFPEKEESQEAKEGTACHELSETLIGLSQIDTVGPSVRDSLVGTSASNGIIFTDEMYDAAWLYADDVAREIAKAGGLRVEWGIETKVLAPRVHAESFGTVDMHLFSPQVNELIIWDFKYGFGIVEAFENWQGINYAAGLFEKYQINGVTDQTLKVTIRIVQPRAHHKDGPIREWVTEGSDLRNYITQLSNNAHEALSDKAQVRTGSHCRYCEALHACPNALRAGMSLFEMVDKPTICELTPEAMGVQLSIVNRALKQLEYIQSSYQEQVKSTIKNGGNVTGWSVAPSFGRKKWAKPLDEVFELGDLMGVELRKKEALTPTQAISKGLDALLIKEYSEVPENGLKLTEIDGAEASRVFKG